MSQTLHNQAEDNLRALQENPYPGRGFILGLNETGTHLIQVYWIMGRSANSRNRVFEDRNGGNLWTAPADPSQLEDPSLIIYRAMAEEEGGGVYVVSNGCQTDLFFGALGIPLHPLEVERSLMQLGYEPDEPNFTPRITGIMTLGGITRIWVVRRTTFPNSDDHESLSFEYGAPCPGLGHCVTTYTGDGNPLPSFNGEPYLMPLLGTPIDIVNRVWDALNVDNRVSLAVKSVDRGTRESRIEIINAYEQIRA